MWEYLIESSEQCWLTRLIKLGQAQTLNQIDTLWTHYCLLFVCLEEDQWKRRTGVSRCAEGVWSLPPWPHSSLSVTSSCGSVSLPHCHSGETSVLQTYLWTSRALTLIIHIVQEEEPRPAPAQKSSACRSWQKEASHTVISSVGSLWPTEMLLFLDFLFSLFQKCFCFFVCEHYIIAQS